MRQILDHAPSGVYQPHDSELQESWANFLHQYDWSVWGTLTFRAQQGVESTRRHFHRYIRRIEQRSQGSVSWFYTIEKSHAAATHVHFLANCARPITTAAMQDAWAQFGWSKIVRYDRKRGARYYLMKEVGTGYLLDHDVSPKLKERYALEQ